jgi:hypothetical protein
MLTSGKSETELPTGWQEDGEIEEVTEVVNRHGDPMFKCPCSFVDATKKKWSLTAHLVDKGKGAWLLRRLCSARGVASLYDAGSVDASDLTPGPIRLKVGIEKGRDGWPDRLRVEDFAPPASDSAVVNLRSAG